MNLIEKISHRLLQDQGQDFSDWAIVFPNKRAGLFFKKHLSQQIDKPIWSPTVLSIAELMEQICPYEKADKFTLIYKLYETFSHFYNEKESFERFFFWGETLIADFDELDKFLVDARLMFKDLSNLKELEGSVDHLNEEQKELISRYWKSFSKNASEEQEKTLAIWKILYPVYSTFQEKLLGQNQAYSGMMYRWVADHLGENIVLPYSNILFGGFNALSRSEEKLITWCVENLGSEIFWDADDYYLNNEFQEAGKNIRDLKNQNQTLASSFKTNYQSNAFENRKIKVIECSTDIGQAQKAGSLLKEILNNGAEPEKIAIILPNEMLLTPVLSALPQGIENLNITMGYPLHNSLSYSFIISLIELQTQAKNKTFYYKDVIRILSHPFLFSSDDEKINDLIFRIKKSNIISPTLEMFDELEEKHQFIFQVVNRPILLINYLKEIILRVAENIDQDSMESEFIFHFYKLLNNLQDFYTETSLETDFKTFTRLLNHAIYRERLPFEGEPLQGLQIMGFMETRNLHFDHVILLSANEGTLPPAKQDISFVPFSVRKAYGLPTVDHSDAIFAYLFYRLIHNTNHINIVYNSSTDGTKTGELSRFVKQLDVESNIEITYATQTTHVFPGKENKIIIRKNKEILDRLKRYTIDKGALSKRFSPSAFSTYLDCSLRFYFRYVLDLYEEEEIEEEIQQRELGNIFHKVIENIYEKFDQPGKRMVVTESIIELKKSVDDHIEQVFRSHFNITENQQYQISGQSELASEIIRNLTLKVLEKDEAYAPFEILGVEANESKGYFINLPVDAEIGNLVVGIKGVIDRLDKKEDVIRIIDYKTGKDTSDFTDIPSLFDRENKARNKAVFQTFLYGLLYENAHPDNEHPLQAGLFNLREIYKEDFDTRIFQKNKSQKMTISDIRPFLDEYKNALVSLLAEIFDPNIDFVQTQDKNKCQFCPYNSICNRDSNK